MRQAAVRTRARTQRARAIPGPRPRTSCLVPGSSTLIRGALAEDVGSGDITSRLTIPDGACGRAEVIAKHAGVVCGLPLCRQVFKTLDPKVRFEPLVRDGVRVRRGQVLARVSGPCRSILTAERTALNFLQRLSGIATLTSEYVRRVKGTKAKILDTRKTIPGWRALDKYAVRCGGGTNHRAGLDDMILVKDNHIATAGSVSEALARCRGTRLAVEVEVKTMAELDEALSAGAKLVMLDNMSPAMMRQAVRRCRGRAKLEASGGVTIATVRAIARTGVDYISVGALTHSVSALDISLDIETARPR